MVEDGAISHKLDYVTILGILNIEGHLNHIKGSRVTTILLSGWNLQFGGGCGGSAINGVTPSILAFV